MLGRLSLTFLCLWTVCCSTAVADEYADRRISGSALREARDILARELFGHYDIVSLELLKLEGVPGNTGLGRDYGLVKATLEFSTKRNASKGPGLNPSLFEPGNCRGWLYLHCGVPVGHVFEGKLHILLAVDRNGEWRAVSPNWQSRRQYSLDGYLVLEGRTKEGYVLFPPQQR